jgi:hypothetical protein
MAEPFDPYLHWLGLRDPERPPNHYRLLGVATYESDPDVLASAADRQMSHVRTFQTGKHSAESQQLLNELATAKVCLLNPDKKAVYDAQLQAEEVRKAVLPPPPVAPPLDEPPIDAESIPPSGEFAEEPTAGPMAWPAFRPRRAAATPHSDSSAVLFFITLLAVIVLILAGLIFVLANVNNGREKPGERGQSNRGHAALTAGQLRAQNPFRRPFAAVDAVGHAHAVIGVAGQGQIGQRCRVGLDP